MIYPKNAAEKLGFNEIRELIKGHCLSEMGRAMVDKIQFMSNFELIDKFLRQTAEFKNIIVNDAQLPLSQFYDIKTLAEKIRIEGTFLSQDEIHRVYISLSTAFTVIQYFNDREGQYPNLEALFEHLPVERQILTSIENVLDQKGKIKNNASRLLSDITDAIAKAELESRKKIDQIFKNAQQNNWTAEGSLTVREGRICIPIAAEFKRKLKGFIHDESASGQTVFIEPEEVFHLNNEIRDLEFEKRREIVRILTELTTELRPYGPLLISYHGLLTKIDFVRAKALFALDIDAEMPVLTQQPQLELVHARHPLLFLNFRKAGGMVVPLHIRIDEDQRIIVVSGPNAGGKSVCMKTVGLLQLMAQAGILIPASEHSIVGIFKQVFADIGDDQSIESDLSTYSAHLSKMKYFTENANAKTLVLIDEFGTGTDPQFGGPIAEAVLEVLNQKNIRGVITTHYSNLKLFANATSGLENASMLFNNEEMQPLYRLEMGKPGSSYAFEIAQKIGLPSRVMEAARNKIGVQQKKVDTLLVDLERTQKELSERQTAIKAQEQRAKQLFEENEKLKAYLEENKRAILKEAKVEAQNILKSANKLIENTISGIKSSHADKAKTKELREKLNAELQQHQTKPALTLGKSKPGTVEIKAGDWVKIRDTDTIAQVIDVSKDNAILAMGDLRSVVKRNRIDKVPDKALPKEARKSYSSQITESISQFRPEMDVRGMRGEEALFELEKYLDRALMMGFPSFKVIHGKGDGILRKVIREYLKKYSHVDRVEDEHADRGGDGISYVYFK